MANRVTADELKEILETELSDTILDTFIGAANRVVTEHLGDDATLSDEQKADIEKFLAAHFCASTREQQAQSEKAGPTGGAQIVYQGVFGLGLDFTGYGQMVRILDTTGILAGALGKRKASVFAVPSFDS
jgi:preprotein translocase subunit SecF